MLGLNALLAALISVPYLPAQDSTPPTTVAEVRRHFVSPPDNARPITRWWWFGAAVTRPELKREILAMKAGGFGGFEIQPVYPLALDDPATGFRNLPYLSPEFLDMVRFAARTGYENHLRVDITLSSGWPYGGPSTPVTEAASCLRMVEADVPAGADSVAAPSLGNGESLLAVFVGAGSRQDHDIASLTLLTPLPAAGRLPLAASSSARFAMFFIASRTGQMVKRPAVGADGFVLDHLSLAAVQHHLDAVAEPLLKAFGDHPPYSVFSDSLEVYGADWSQDFLAEFRKRRGYDLTPYLPALYTGAGPFAAAVRRDWGLTQTELVNERYLTPIDGWARAHHTQFRSQTYGEPAVSMSSNRLVSLPEGEGPQWRSFSYTRWASSASHLYHRQVTSAETWTWLHSPAFRATPLDMKAEADRMLLEGVNQFVAHGWPYTPPGVPEPGWAFYAAAVFNDHNPWWLVMPDVTLYLRRLSYLLRQGKPANDVAVFLPDDDAYASFSPGHASLSSAMATYVTPALTGQILDAGFNLDYIDEEAIGRVGIPYPVLVLPHVTRMSPQLVEKLTAYAARGGKVIAVGALPSEAPGLRNASALSALVRRNVQQLFASGSGVTPGSGAVQVADDDALGAALQAAYAPDMRVGNHASDTGFVHRKLEDADIYFIANTSNHAVHTAAAFRSTRRFATWWNPYDGSVADAGAKPFLDLAPYESRVLVFTGEPQAAEAIARHGPEAEVTDLAHDWRVAFVPSGPASSQGPAHTGNSEAKTVAYGSLHSWTDDPDTRFFSGVAVYTKDVQLTAAQLQGRRLLLNFGEGAPVDDTGGGKSGMRALLESPIREAAMVRVNGRRAGSVWRPPYTLDVTALLRPGANHLEIRVGNLGINALAGRAPEDYRLLNSRYGVRFVPQDMQDLQPLPSGILGPVRLMAETAE
jgi:hypothetical protein